MKHLLAGGTAIFFGLIGLVLWWKTFGMVMRGVIPFTLLIFGIVAMISGLRRISGPPRADLEADEEA